MALTLAFMPPMHPPLSHVTMQPLFSDSLAASAKQVWQAVVVVVVGLNPLLPSF